MIELEILFYAIIAFFVISKLKNSLGNSEEVIIDSVNQDSNQFYNNENVINSENHIVEYTDKEMTSIIIQNQDEIIKEILKIKEKNENFILKRFIQTVELIYEKLIIAFDEKDEIVFTDLCSPEISAKFIKKIEEFKDKNYKKHNKIITLKSFIDTIVCTKDTISITIKFVSTQYLYVENEKNEIVEGSKDESIVINEHFLFHKENSVNNNIWTIKDIY